MDKTLVFLGLVTAGLIAVAAGMALTAAPDNAAIAKRFVMDEPTYKFDGMEETLKVELDESCDPATATVEFTSRQAGYGDRTGMMLAQVLTPHECAIKISGGQVKSAVMDGKWDMIGQKEIGA